MRTQGEVRRRAYRVGVVHGDGADVRGAVAHVEGVEEAEDVDLGVEAED